MIFLLPPSSSAAAIVLNSVVAPDPAVIAIRVFLSLPANNLIKKHQPGFLLVPELNFMFIFTSVFRVLKKQQQKNPKN